MCVSPSDPNNVTLCTTERTIKSWNINNQNFDVSKKYPTNCSKIFKLNFISNYFFKKSFLKVSYSTSGKTIVAYSDENILILLDSKKLEERGRIQLPIDKNLNC
jgi:hypothetical protein